MKNELMIRDLEGFKVFVPNGVLSEVPMMTAQVLSAILFKGPDHKRPQMTDACADMTYYVVDSSGEVSSFELVRKKAAQKERGVL